MRLLHILIIFSILPITANGQSIKSPELETNALTIRIQKALSVTEGSYQAVNSAIKESQPNEYVPILIGIVSNTSANLLSSNAAFWLTFFYTDNGAPGYNYIKPLEENIDSFLLGLSNVSAQKAIVEVLGSRFTGDTFAPCLMSSISRQKIISALAKQRNINKESSYNRYELNNAKQEINSALKNIRNCGAGA